MWVNKNHPNVIYGDIRQEKKGFWKHRKNVEVQPDMILDFRDLPFESHSFKLVVFDPPHYVTRSYSQFTEKYGKFHPDTWQRDLKQGFDECWRVLEEYGVLMFKWSEVSKKHNELAKIIGHQPLFYNNLGGQKTGTYWACYMKLPQKYNLQETLE